MGGMHHHGWVNHPHQHRGPGAHTGEHDHIYSPKHHNGVFKGAGICTFMNAPYCPPEREAVREAGAKVAFLGVPYDEGNVCRPGSSSGPQGLRTASTQYFPYVAEIDTDLLRYFNVVDCGDVPIVPTNPDRSHEYIHQYITECLEGGAMVILCGGDHSVPVPGARALSDYYQNGKIGYCAYDCHIDASPDWGGVLNTNCSGTSRAVELPNCDGSNITHVGSRNGLNPKDWVDFAYENGMSILSMSEIIARGIETVSHEAMTRCFEGCDSVYVTIDTDSLDSACSPGTTAPEPGGITSREILSAARVIGSYGPRAVELSELCPIYDKNNITSKLTYCVIQSLLAGYAEALINQSKSPNDRTA